MSMAMRMADPVPHGALPRRGEPLGPIVGPMATATTGDRATVAVDQYGPSGRSPWLDIDWGEHLRWVRVEGRWMNVVDLGPADPADTIVWIHGLSGSWQNWLE